MNTNKLADVATLIVMVAGISVMVRPNSQGYKLVNAIVGGFANALSAAMGNSASATTTGRISV